jgi:hypothetical protein
MGEFFCLGELEWSICEGTAGWTAWIRSFTSVTWENTLDGGHTNVRFGRIAHPRAKTD